MSGFSFFGFASDQYRKSFEFGVIRSTSDKTHFMDGRNN